MTEVLLAEVCESRGENDRTLSTRGFGVNKARRIQLPEFEDVWVSLWGLIKLMEAGERPRLAKGVEKRRRQQTRGPDAAVGESWKSR